MCEVASGADRLEAVRDEPATAGMVAHLDAMIARYLAGEPLAYVLGRWSFRHVDLAVDRRVLIPRPETEVVAGVAIDLARALPRPTVVADLGTGSGAIGLSLADELPVDGVTVWLTDASDDALDVARANLAGLGRRAANVRIAGGHLVRRAAHRHVARSRRQQSALRGVGQRRRRRRSWRGSPTRRCSPGPTGSTTSARSSSPHRGWLRPGGWLVLEIGADQGDAVERLLVGRGYTDVAIRPDLAGRDRVAVALAHRSSLMSGARWAAMGSREAPMQS